MIERKFVVLFNGKFFLKATKGFILFIVGSLFIYSILVIKNEVSRSSGEIFLIPENYIGFIYIIYNEKEGGIEKENGIYTYKIPASGIYRTSLSFIKGYICMSIQLNFTLLEVMVKENLYQIIHMEKQIL